MLLLGTRPEKRGGWRLVKFTGANVEQLAFTWQWFFFFV